MTGDAKYHFMASIHHAAKAQVYRKLGHRESQVRHAARALDHKLRFGATQYFDDDDDYENDPDIQRLEAMMAEHHGNLLPDEMLPPKRRVAPAAQWYTASRAPVATTRSSWDEDDRTPHLLRGVPSVLIKPSDFIKDKWQRAKLQTILRDTLSLRNLNNSKRVTVDTPIPSYVMEQIVSTHFKHKLDEWRTFIKEESNKFLSETYAETLD